MSGIDDTLNWAIPALLIIIALGFVYTKLINPYVTPLLINFWNWAKGSTERQELGQHRREIIYE